MLIDYRHTDKSEWESESECQGGMGIGVGAGTTRNRPSLIVIPKESLSVTMYRGMTHYEFILALHTVLSSYKTHY